MDLNKGGTMIGLLLLALTLHHVAGNPCCSFPCQNRGVCMTQGFKDFTCDCTNTGYTGKTCETPATYKKWFVEKIRPSSETLHHVLTNYKWLWDIVNYITPLRQWIMRKVYLIRADSVDSPPLYNSEHSYTTLGVTSNTSWYARALPPVPDNCPTPMGVVGPKVLPDVDLLVEKLFTRKEFIPEVLGSNVFFSFFAQSFTHMFFKTDVKKGPGFTWGGHGVDVSSVYGPDKHTENTLRTFKGGLLKTQRINGEDWPPFVDEAPVKMLYPPHIPKSKQFALGHEFFGLMPGLVVYATIWVREHNRVARILQGEHPEWDDERIFQTAKLVILGETIKIVIEDYVQHLSNYHLKVTFEPELLAGYPFQYQNKIAMEFNHLYHWHPLMPDTFNVSGKMYNAREYLFNADLPTEQGMKSMVESMIHQRAGKMSHSNHPHATHKFHVAKQTVLHGRELKFQSFNNYRRRFRLPAYTSFEDFTGETEMAKVLEEFYGDIEAVEFYVGVMLEKHREHGMFGSTIIEMGGPFSVKGLMSVPICSPNYWKPSTFGGQRGFDLVKGASLEKLFCENMGGEDCPRIAFTVPEGRLVVEEETKTPPVTTRPASSSVTTAARAVVTCTSCNPNESHNKPEL